MSAKVAIWGWVGLHYLPPVEGRPPIDVCSSKAQKGHYSIVYKTDILPFKAMGMCILVYTVCQA